MNPTSVDIKDLLVIGAHGVFAATTGWSIHIGVEPDNPDTTITLYDTPAEPANPKFLLDFPRWQIRVRGTGNSYPTTYAKALQIRDALLGLPSQTLGGTVYVGIYLVNDIFFLQQDKASRPIFVSNWRAFRQPSSGDHRQSL